MSIAGEVVAQIQKVMDRGHGDLILLYVVDPETGQRYDVQVETGIDAAPAGVYVALVAVAPTPVGR
jgi:hypothetical protein